jgi:hypothetical protein
MKKNTLFLLLVFMLCGLVFVGNVYFCNEPIDPRDREYEKWVKEHKKEDSEHKGCCRTERLSLFNSLLDLLWH